MKFLIKKAGGFCLLIIGITFLSFLLSYLSPGDPAQILLNNQGVKASEEALQSTRHELGLDRATAVLAEMDADEAVDILENLDQEEKEALIARMDQESKDDIHLIFSYDEEQIGSRMTTNYIVIPNNCTIKQAMRHLISQA